jgi:hypothetical protein
MLPIPSLTYLCTTSMFCFLAFNTTYWQVKTLVRKTSVKVAMSLKYALPNQHLRSSSMRSKMGNFCTNFLFHLKKTVVADFL